MIGLKQKNQTIQMKNHDANSDPVLSSRACRKMKALASVDQKLMVYVQHVEMTSTEYMVLAYLQYVVTVYHPSHFTALLTLVCLSA